MSHRPMGPRAGTGLLVVLIAVLAFAASASASQFTKPFNRGVSASKTAKTEPHWACPHAACLAIVDPRPTSSAALFANGSPAGGGELGGIDPEELRAAYGIPVTGGADQTVAVIEGYSYAKAESDLAKYRSRYGISACTSASGCLTIVNSSGGTPASHPGNEWEGEDALDLDMVSAACPECHLILVSAEGESWNQLGAAVNRAAAMGATEISNSYGLPEETCTSECKTAESDWNHPGLFVSVSAGDTGYDNEFEGASSPSYPAALPTVAAIGGTALQKAGGGRGYKEKAWGEKGLGLGTGSGCSTWPKPSWQTDTGCSGRTENDVSAVGACKTPVSVYATAEGGWTDLCGTSASSPLVAGIEAHSSAASRAMPGGEAFYTEGLLFDVKGGTNGRCTTKYFCKALKGYDAPTGLGSPDGPLP